MNYYLVFTLGVIFGGVITNIISGLNKGYGVLRIDSSNPKKDVYRIEFDNLENLSKRKYIMLKVDANANLSRK